MDYFLSEIGHILIILVPVFLCTAEKPWQFITGQNIEKEEE